MMMLFMTPPSIGNLYIYNNYGKIKGHFFIALPEVVFLALFFFGSIIVHLDGVYSFHCTPHSDEIEKTAYHWSVILTLL